MNSLAIDMKKCSLGMARGFFAAELRVLKWVDSFFVASKYWTMLGQISNARSATGSFSSHLVPQKFLGNFADPVIFS